MHQRKIQIVLMHLEDGRVTNIGQRSSSISFLHSLQRSCLSGADICTADSQVLRLRIPVASPICVFISFFTGMCLSSLVLLRCHWERSSDRHCWPCLPAPTWQCYPPLDCVCFLDSSSYFPVSQLHTSLLGTCPWPISDFAKKPRGRDRPESHF